MTRVGRCDRKDLPAQLRLFQPSRKRAPEDPRPTRTQSASRDDEHTAPSCRVRDCDEGRQRPVRLGLCHSVQVESRLDFVQTALEPLSIGAVYPGEAIKWRERWRQASARFLDPSWTGIRSYRDPWGCWRLTSTQRLHVANRFLP